MLIGRNVLYLAGALLVSTQAHADEQAAIDGCIDQLRVVGGPDGAGGRVLSSDFSEAGTLVMLEDAGGSVWRCLAYSDGSVEELSVAEAADDGGGAMDGSGMDDGSGGIVVHFPPGSSGTTLNGAVRGREYVDYVLGARAGQTMHATLRVIDTNGDGVIYFNILPPGSDNEAIYVGSMEDEPEADVRLPENGDYKIRVYLMGNDRDADKTVGYEIDVSVR